jgi:hypothetical protein
LNSGKLIPLLLATTPRLLGFTSALAPVTAISYCWINFILGSKLFSSNGNTMSDEVAAAKAMARLVASSDIDGAGPSTVFDNILSGKWPSDKVHKDDLLLVFCK